MSENVVNTCQPEPSDGETFLRTFAIHMAGVAEDIWRDVTHPVHEANLLEVARDATRRGLRPVGDVTVAAVEPHPAGVTAVTYSVPVAVTDAPPVPFAPGPATVAPTGPEPEFTVPDEPAKKRSGRKST